MLMGRTEQGSCQTKNKFSYVSGERVPSWNDNKSYVSEERGPCSTINKCYVVWEMGPF